jgi:hypothetical protein
MHPMPGSGLVPRRAIASVRPAADPPQDTAGDCRIPRQVHDRPQLHTHQPAHIGI